jgi:16S rRNA (cytidine1402-2'-O)-methyltransferase
LNIHHAGTLFLIPNTLGETAPRALSHVLPEQVQQITSQLDYFVAENAKTARAFLKLVNAAIRWRAAAGNRSPN